MPMLALWGPGPGQVSYAAGIWAPLYSPSVAMQLATGSSMRSGTTSQRYQNEFSPFQEHSGMGVTCFSQRESEFHSSVPVLQAIPRYIQEHDFNWMWFLESLLSQGWVCKRTFGLGKYPLLCQGWQHFQTSWNVSKHLLIPYICVSHKLRTNLKQGPQRAFKIHQHIMYNIGKMQLISFNFLLSMTLMAWETHVHGQNNCI